MKNRIHKWLRRQLPKIGLSLKSDLDAAYKQRDIAAMVAGRFAEEAGHTVSRYRDDSKGWDEEWQTVLQIDWVDSHHYNRQISWHMSPTSQPFCENAFWKEKYFEWDGTYESRDYFVMGGLESPIHTH